MFLFDVINVSKKLGNNSFLFFSLACAAGKLLLDIVRENGKKKTLTLK